MASSSSSRLLWEPKRTFHPLPLHEICLHCPFDLSPSACSVTAQFVAQMPISQLHLLPTHLAAALHSPHCQFGTSFRRFRGLNTQVSAKKEDAFTFKESSTANATACMACCDHSGTGKAFSLCLAAKREQFSTNVSNCRGLCLGTAKKHEVQAVTDSSPSAETDEIREDFNDNVQGEWGDRQADARTTIASGIGAYASKALAVGEYLPPEGLIVLMSCAVGLLTGVGVVLFNLGVHELHDIVWHGIPRSGASWLRTQPVEEHWIQVLSVPAGGGLIVGILNFFRESRGNLDVDMLEASRSNAKNKAVFWSQVREFLQPVVKTMAAVVTLATGNSLGPEGPSVEIGASIANGLGTAFKNSRERKLSLIAAGSAAGISSGFNAAISGCFFAVESVLRSSTIDSTPSLTTAMVILSSVLASVISRAGLGSDPAFKIPQYDFRSLAELPLYLVLGILCGLVSVGLTKCSNYSVSVFSTIKRVTGVPAALFPPFGGLCVGIIALAYPEILYWGFENVDVLLESRLVQRGPPMMLLFQLVGAKIVATSICRGTGLVGGIYAPSLFTGAALGSAYGKLVGYAVPHADPLYHLDALKVAAPQAYALVGMAAMLAGVCQVPLTSVLLLFELTRDYRIIIPLMAAVGLSSWIASASAKKSQQPQMIDKTSEPFFSVKTSDLVKTKEFLFRTSTSMKSLLPDTDKPISSAQRPMPFEHNNLDDGICSLDNSLCLATKDIDEEKLLTEITVAAAMRTCFAAVSPDTKLHSALDLMLLRREWCVLLVSNGNKLEGIVTFSDIQQGARRLSNDGPAKVDTLTVAAICSSWATEGPGFSLVTAYPDMDLRMAQRLMAGQGLRQLPVISHEVYLKDKIKVVVGILDRDSIQRACRAEATRRILGMPPLSSMSLGNVSHED